MPSLILKCSYEYAVNLMIHSNNESLEWDQQYSFTSCPIIDVEFEADRNRLQLAKFMFGPFNSTSHRGV